MIVAVIIVFTVCWTPFQIVLVLKAFGLYDDHKYESLVIFEIIMRCLAYGNSCLNPLLYAFFSPNFRSAFIQALSKSSLRDVRDRNSRKKSSSGGRARTSKDINPENSGSLLGRSKFAAENRLAKVSIELQPLSTNTPEVTVKKNRNNIYNVNGIFFTHPAKYKFGIKYSGKYYIFSLE